MIQAKNGDTVKVHYTGKLDDGSVFDSSVGRDPIEFTLGEGRVIKGFEDAVMGASPGDTKTTRIPSDKAYGPHEEERVVRVDRSNLPDGLDPEIGDQLQMTTQAGMPVVVTVTEADEESITLDANHPLAGKDLTFDIELVEIV
jgi:peptidylprolyl isomerase